jgi:predicted alpha-1,6-mannanase (GH76 family)
MSEPDHYARAAAGIDALQRWHSRWTGQWRTTGWWNAANALTTVISFIQRTGDRRHAPVIEKTFRAAGRLHPGFIVRYFDDNGWWGLAWLAAYDLTGEDRYLDAARVIFANMATSWDETCGGGVWWNQDRKYKNAITNELFLSLAAQLHLRSPNTGGSYLAWALREFEWFRESGMIGGSGLVNDGLTPECANNGKPTWTYNQGVILGGLAALHKISGDTGYITLGESIADAALRQLTSPPEASSPGILIEPGEAEMARARRRGDGSQFKGIFVRNLYDFYLHSRRPAYREFMLRNARSIWDNSRNADNQFGLCWTGPFDTADASRQSSALDALNAAVAVAAELPGPDAPEAAWIGSFGPC